jgi:hypothetical protein
MLYFDSQLGYESELMDEWVEKEMHTQKKDTLRKLSSVVAHFSSEFSNILAYGWLESLPEAKKLADLLDLSKIDFLAIQEDLQGFKKEFLKDQECVRDFYFMTQED